MQIWKITHVLIIYSEYQFYDTAGYIFFNSKTYKFGVKNYTVFLIKFQI